MRLVNKNEAPVDSSDFKRTLRAFTEKMIVDMKTARTNEETNIIDFTEARKIRNMEPVQILARVAPEREGVIAAYDVYGTYEAKFRKF